jgi:hypothetical protein
MAVLLLFPVSAFAGFLLLVGGGDLMLLNGGFLRALNGGKLICVGHC